MADDDHDEENDDEENDDVAMTIARRMVTRERARSRGVSTYYLATLKPL